MALLLHRLGAALLMAFEALACLASVAVLVLLACAPLYAFYLPFEPLAWHWAAAFMSAVAIAVAASWIRSIFDRRLPARIGGDPRHAHISGWTFFFIIGATCAIVALATWAAGSETNRETINTDWGERITFALVIAFMLAAILPALHIGDRASGLINFIGRLIHPFGRALSILDSILVFAVAGAAGVTQRSMFVRYLSLFGTLGACAAMGYWLEPPWGLAPLAWGFLVAIAISRRWAWIETDRELAMLNRRFVGPHLRIGFAQDLRDEALLSFAFLLLLVPLGLRQAQIGAFDAHYELFNVTLEEAENLRTWIGFFGTELAKAVPFVDWAEVYDVGGSEDAIVRSEASQHFVFVTRILVDFVFLAALLQALSISARNAAQRGLFYEGQIPRLDPFLEPREFHKLLRRAKGGRMTPDPERVAAFPQYDPIRLSELAGESRDPLVRRAVNAVRVAQGGSNIEEFHAELAKRVRTPLRDKAAILEVTNAIQATGRKRDIALLDELRRELNEAPRLLEVRVDVARLMTEAEDSQEKTAALVAMLHGARDNLSPVRLLALGELAAAARRGHEPTRQSLAEIAASDELNEGERKRIQDVLEAPPEPEAQQDEPRVSDDVGVQTPADIAAAERVATRSERIRTRQRNRVLEWVGLALFGVVGGTMLYAWQNPAAFRFEQEVAVVDLPDNAAPVEPVQPQQRTVFRDCEDCPEMMSLTGGTFRMGAREDDPGRRSWESPLHERTLAPFAIGVREVTFAEWDACVADGGCDGYAPPDRGWGRGDRPVIMVSWRDAQRYVRWLSETTGRAYRLPSEAEWEFAARGGSETQFWWGDAFEPNRFSRERTAEAGASEANAFGLYDMTGNVSEWVEDCYVNNFVDAPGDGRAVTRGDCARRVLRGGSWRDEAGALRVASRSRVGQTVRDAGIGFRVARAD